MPKSQLSLGPLEVKAVHSRAGMTLPAPGEELHHERLTALLASTVAQSMSEKDAALSQGYTPAYWSMVKSGEKNAQLDAIAGLPHDVQRAFVTAWATRLGLHVLSGDKKRQAIAKLVSAAADCLLAVEEAS